MTPAEILPVKPGDRVLDICAAPGGKSTELAAKLQGKGVLVSNDISNSRAKALLKNLELFGSRNSLILSEAPGKLTERFRGTAVQMALANDAEVDLGAVMSRYVDPVRGFVRTEIPVYRFFGGESPVSRSEARRLAAAIGAFEEVELDLADVEEIGHDFAHELFTVQAAKMPALHLLVKNAVPMVENALRRAGYRAE